MAFKMSYTVLVGLLKRPSFNIRLFSTTFIKFNPIQLKLNRCIHNQAILSSKILQFSPGSFIAARAMGSSAIKNINVSEYVNMREDPKTTIIDVREKSEIAETGILPGASSIPSGEISDAFQKDCDTFKKQYSFDKPGQEDRIIFSCRSGKRSMMAAEAAHKLGFTNVLNLQGGWMAWEEYNKK